MSERNKHMTLEELRTIIKESVGCDEISFSDDENLLDSGILDSLGIITLAELLEDKGISFSPSRLPHEKFTPIGIYGAVSGEM